MSERPPILYKYLNKDGAISFLKKPQVRFTHWRNLDDLMEILPGSRLMTEEEIKRHARVKFLECRGVVSEQKCQIYIKRTNELSVTSFWEREAHAILDERPIDLYISSMSARSDSGAMWAIYADRHQGIVFGLSEAIDGIRNRGAYLEPVVYESVRSQCPFPYIETETLNRALRTKSTDWGYQKEWRLIAGSKADEFLTPGDVAEVIIGYRASPEIEALALEFKKAGTRVFRAYPHPHQHLITREPL